MSTFTQDLTRTLEAHARGLARIRRIGVGDAWTVIAQTCRDIARESRGTEAETYWRAALAVAERQQAAEADPRWGDG